MDKTILILITLAGIFMLVSFLRRCFTRRTVYEYQKGLLYKKGVFKETISPGSYWINTLTSTLQIVDMRTSTLTVGAQEIITGDNIGLKISLSVTYKIEDPAKYINDFKSADNELYTLIQLTARNNVSKEDAQELLSKRSELSQAIYEEAKSKTGNLGIELEATEIKDIMFPQEMRKIFGEVVRARLEGQAALERARGEQAALRNLANAARTLENNPALMNLRILQALESEKGNLVLGMPQGLFPVSASGVAKDNAS